jgi:hypothetical protein
MSYREFFKDLTGFDAHLYQSVWRRRSALGVP